MSILGTVRIKCSCTNYLKENLDRISVLFAARLEENSENGSDLFVTTFNVFSLAPSGCERAPSADFITRLQKYVDDICGEGCTQRLQATAGEDSSYDSDYDPETSSSHHKDVSRTASDTLAAEYADYVDNAAVGVAAPSPGYAARVEFALKLGYTEKLVQSALHKLGPTPQQNELLAELIKLGAQKTSAGIPASCDSSPTEVVGDEGGGPGLFRGEECLKAVVIDGSNVAMSHGNKEIFSCRGIKLCVDWFKSRGHREITVFVPKWRKEAARPDNPIRDQEILADLEKDRMLVFTPSRLVGGKRMVCYDDRYILKLAAELDGIVVSNDNYRDLCQENIEFKRVVEERILMYSFVNDRFMPPDDPLGRSGPTLDNFLRAQPRRSEPPPPCPYSKKCTYGNKCKYYHPERGSLPHKSVTERLSEHVQRHLMAREGDVRKMPLGRTRSNVPPAKDAANAHTVVAKSRSVDNVGENLHRKLARQLTLNTGGVRHFPNVLMQQQQQQQQNWDMYGQHANVTRIASAPDSLRQQQAAHAHYMQRMSSCSDTQLNVWQVVEEARRKMHYHLAAIFPEEQVVQVMQMYPEETNPQKICAAILGIFPKS